MNRDPNFEPRLADERAIEIAKLLSKMVNVMGANNPGLDLAELISRDHRTLQQSTMREVIVPLMRIWAQDAENGYYDDRNEATVMAAMHFVLAIDQAKIGFPFV